MPSGSIAQIAKENLRARAYLHEREVVLNYMVRFIHDAFNCEVAAIHLSNESFPDIFETVAFYCDLRVPEGVIFAPIKAEEVSHGGLTAAVAYRARPFRDHGRKLRENRFVKPGVSPFLARGICHSALIVPMQVGEKVAGIIRLDNKKNTNGFASDEVFFSEEDEREMEAIAAEIETLLYRRREFDMFSSVLSDPLLVGTRSPKVLEDHLTAMCEAFTLAGAILYRVDDKTKFLTAIAFSRSVHRDVSSKGFSYRIDEGALATLVVKVHRSILTQEPWNDDRVNSVGLKTFDIKGPLLAIPVLDGKLAVAVCVFWGPKGEVLTIETQNTLERLVNPLASYLLERDTSENSSRAQHLLLDNSPAGFFVKDLNKRFVYCNPCFCKFLGVTFAELKGKTDHDIFQKELADRFANDDEKVLHGSELINQSEHSSTAKGELKVVRVVKTALHSVAGETIGILGALIDVTGEHVSEFRSGGTAYFYWNIDFDMLTASPAIYDLFQIPKGKPVSFSETVMNRIHPLDRALVRFEINQLRSDRKPFSRYFRIRHDDGAVRILEIQGRPSYDSEMRVNVLLGAIEDITDRLTLRREAIEVSRLQLLSDFGSALRHEIKAKLALARTVIGKVKQRASENKSLQESCDVADRAVGISSGVAEIFQVLFGRNNNLVKAESICQVLAEAVKNVSTIAAQQDIKVTVEPPSKTVKVFAPRALLLMLLQNLIQNAIEAMETGGEVSISLSFGTPQFSETDRLDPSVRFMEDTEVIIEIADNGPGVDEEQDWFKPGVTSKLNPEGKHGYGLFTCRIIAKLFNWKVTLKNRGRNLAGAVAVVYMNGFEEPASKIL